MVTFGTWIHHQASVACTWLVAYYLQAVEFYLELIMTESERVSVIPIHDKFHRIHNLFPQNQSYIYNYYYPEKNMQAIHIYIEENQCSVTERFLSTNLGMVTIPPIKMLSHKNRIMGYIMG